MSIVEKLVMGSVGLMVGTIVILGSWVTYDSFEYEKKRWNAQNECIASKVALGIERRNINRSGYSCTIVGE